MSSPSSTPSSTNSGQGILGTHVLWDDIETEARNSIKTSATFGPNKQVKAIGEGIGFFSRVCLIHPDWQNASPDLPNKFVVKITKQFTQNEQDGEDEIRAFLDRESAYLLKAESNSYELFNKYGDESFAIEKMYGYRCLDETNTTKGFLIMEYIDNIEAINLFDNISIENCREVLKVVAKWQAVSLKHSSEFEPIFETHFLTKVFGRTVSRKTCSQSVEGLASIDHPLVPHMLGKLREIVEELCTEESLQEFDDLPEKLNMKRVYNHFDLWSANVLWKRNKDGNLSLRSVLDYQLACLTNPMYDIVMFLICSLNADVRRTNTKRLIEDFHGYLSAEMGGQSPFTIEQLEESYQRVFPISVLLICGSISPVYYFLKKANPSASDEIDDVFDKKFVPTFQEVIEKHELNKKMFA